MGGGGVLPLQGGYKRGTNGPSDFTKIVDPVGGERGAYETLPVLSWEQIYNLHREENRHGQLMQDIVDATEGNPQETAELVMPTQIL